MKPTSIRRVPWAVFALWVICTLPAQAQWLTQSFNLRAGWNAIYLHVDASHATLDQLVGGDTANLVQEIWMWAPNPAALQFVTRPQAPAQAANWLNWARPVPPSTTSSGTLTRLQGNAAYLVRVSAEYTWNLKGRAVAPSYHWTSSGLNFLGFPTVPGATPPNLDTFFSPAPELRSGAELFAYNGGAIGDNPVQVLDLTATKAARGQAFWIRAPDFNRYFGPFEVVFAGPTGVRFGETVGQVSFRLRNVTDRELTVTLTGVASEAAPAGQTAVRGAVPVLVRGPVNPATLGYQHSVLAGAPQRWTLPKAGEPGSDIEVVLGVDRQRLTGAAGDQYASILRLTDSLGYTQVDVPVTATVGANTGLWVGGATVSSVSHYLKRYAKAANAAELTALLTRLGLAEGVDGYHYERDPATGRVLVFGGPNNQTGAYLLDGEAKTDPGTVARPFPLRLIVHDDGTRARLLQRVFHGVGAGGQAVLSTREEAIPAAQLATARRISAVHLPVSAANTPWNFNGPIRPGATLTATVETAHDDQSSNPFLHTYHPDHDNLDASFRATQPPGRESYGIRREITLTLAAPAADFDSLTRASGTLNGSYVEVVTLLGGSGPARRYDTRGSFVLNRISDIATLTVP